MDEKQRPPSNPPASRGKKDERKDSSFKKMGFLRSEGFELLSFLVWGLIILAVVVSIFRAVF